MEDEHLLIGSDFLGYLFPVLLPCFLCSFAIEQALGILGRLEPFARRQRRGHYRPLTSQRHRTSFRKHYMPRPRDAHLCSLSLLLARCVHTGRAVRLG